MRSLPVSATHGYVVHALVEAWITQHPYVDSALQIAIIILLTLAGLVGVSGIVYWILWLGRMLNPWNLASFVRAPIPRLRRGKVAGQEFEIDVARIIHIEREAAASVDIAGEELRVRLDALEGALRKLEARLNATAKKEDV